MRKEKENESVKIAGLRIESKCERGPYEDRDVHEKSSNIRAFNIYEQDYETIVALGMEELFANEAEFIERKRLYHERKSE